MRKTITVVVASEFFDFFDRYCRERGHKKSTLIAKLIKDHLEHESFSVQQELGAGRTPSAPGIRKKAPSSTTSKL